MVGGPLKLTMLVLRVGWWADLCSSAFQSALSLSQHLFWSVNSPSVKQGAHINEDPKAVEVVDS